MIIALKKTHYIGHTVAQKKYGQNSCLHKISMAQTADGAKKSLAVISTKVLFSFRNLDSPYLLSYIGWAAPQKVGRPHVNKWGNLWILIIDNQYYWIYLLEVAPQKVGRAHMNWWEPPFIRGLTLLFLTLLWEVWSLGDMLGTLIQSNWFQQQKE